MKKIAEVTGGTRQAKIYRDSEHDEYVVRLYEDGKHKEEADYFTSDKQDAFDTGMHMIDFATRRITIG